jgi:hypothetical protein
MDSNAFWGLIGVLLGSAISITYSWCSEDRSTKKRINWELRQRTYLDTLRITLKFVNLMSVSADRLVFKVKGQGSRRESLKTELHAVDLECLQVALAVVASEQVLMQFDKLAPIFATFEKNEQAAIDFHGSPSNLNFKELVGECKKLSLEAKQCHEELEQVIRKELGQK